MFEFILLAPLAAAATSSTISPGMLIGVITGLITVLTILAKILEKKVFGKADREMRKNTNKIVGGNSRKLEDLLEYEKTIAAQLTKLYELHDVKDSDNIPIWYMTTNLKNLISETNKMVNEMKLMVSDTDENSELILSKLPELISSNQAMTTRLTDLVILLEKTASKISS